MKTQREDGHRQTQESSQEKLPCLANLPIKFLSNVYSTLCFHYYHLNLDCVFIWNIQITISSSSSSFNSNIHSHVSKATTLWNCWEWSLCTLFLSTIYNLWFLNLAVHQNLGGIFLIVWDYIVRLYLLNQNLKACGLEIGIFNVFLSWSSN